MAINKLKKSSKTNYYQNEIKDTQDYSLDPAALKKKVPFAVVEAYKTMRTNIMFMLAKQNGKVLAFTSANASDGKSTTSINIAIAFSQLGGKIIVIDADMRRSSIHKKMRMDNSNGLSNVLAGFSTFEDAVQVANPNLDVLTAGPTPPNPSELLGSLTFDALIEKLREKYDYVIIDTPPINIVTDPLLIGPRTDGMVLVVRDSYSPRDSIRRAINSAKFANIKILGAVMNGANPKNTRRYTYSRYSYKYGFYKYGYGYGRGYGSYSSSYGNAYESDKN